MSSEVLYCTTEGCQNPAIGEELYAMLDEYEIVELKCIECLSS